MPVTESLSAIAAEPASILYIVTGVVGLAYAGLFKSGEVASKPSVAMLFCKRKSRAMLESLHLL